MQILRRARCPRTRSNTDLWNTPALDEATRDRAVTSWQAVAYRGFRETILDSAFPCFYAGVAHQRDTLRYHFLEDTSAESIVSFAAATKQYLAEVRELELESAQLAAFQLLIVFVRTGQRLSLEDEQKLAWQLMALLHLADPAPWPERIPQDPNNPAWSFCWDGMPLFVNVSASGHERRKSRKLGSHLTLVIQPRDAFDHVAGNTPEGRKIRANIRDRVAAYDDVPPSPLLGTYGTPDSLEWVQYALPDDNVEVTSRCPFHRLLRKMGIRPGAVRGSHHDSALKETA